MWCGVSKSKKGPRDDMLEPKGPLENGNTGSGNNTESGGNTGSGNTPAETELEGDRDCMCTRGMRRGARARGATRAGQAGQAGDTRAGAGEAASGEWMGALP